MRFASYGLTAAAILAIGACAPGVSTVGQHSPLFTSAENNRAMNGRDVFVIVHGGSYGVEKASFNQSVLDNMQRNRSGMRTRFTATPQNNYNPDYKVVMLFNGPSSAQAADLCKRPEQYAAVAPTASGDTNVLAAFCKFDAPLTEVTGRAIGVTSVSDARFASLIRSTMTDLFPLVNDPQRDGGGGGGDIP